MDVILAQWVVIKFEAAIAKEGSLALSHKTFFGFYLDHPQHQASSAVTGLQEQYSCKCSSDSPEKPERLLDNACLKRKGKQ